jgi:small subunit ribosomal protein S1
MEESNLNFEALLRQSQLKPTSKEVVSGTIVEIGKDYVTLDIGFKGPAFCPLSELKLELEKAGLKVGDQIDVIVTSMDDFGGKIYVSYDQACQFKFLKRMADCLNQRLPVKGKVMFKVKGGLQVDVGGPAFLPASQVDLVQHKNLDKFLGQEFEFLVIKIDEAKGSVIVSRKALLEERKEKLRSETLKVLQEGLIVEGTVKSLVDYGAFIDIGEVEGLLHVSDISWGRISHPSEKLQVGQKIVVVVLKYDPEKERLNFGLKQLQPDPWLSVYEKYSVGQKVKGKAVEVTPDGGIILEVEEGIDCFIPSSELSWTKRVPNVSKIVADRQELEVMITSIDNNIGMLRGSLRQLFPNPWEEVLKKYPVGSVVKAPVTSVTDFGIFLRLTDEIDGLVHVSDFSWTHRITNPKQIHQLFRKGQVVEAKVLEIDPQAEKVSLGIKQLTPDPWSDIVARYPKGRRVKCKVKVILDFGLVVELEPELDALIHISELEVPKGEKLESIYPIGSELEAEVIKIDHQQRRISLSVKSLKRKEVEAPVMSGSGTVTFLDILKQKLQR